ncbi:MAG: D-inositol-3-phosphate glycosyltransferase [Pedosphaera sp.]|nr:D-inositol-3-phosphate glycosyltransferase [Pedosphaera sp.]
MKLLIDHHLPFLLAHGGLQIQIEQTRRALISSGVECEYLRWWDKSQSGDVIHFFGKMPTHLLHFAQSKGLKVVISDLLAQQGTRSPGRLKLQKFLIRSLKATIPGVIRPYNWDSYRLADACIALTSWEAFLFQDIFAVPAEKLHVIPNGVEEVFLQSRPVPRGQWLVCTSTIAPHKRVLELAQAAVQAQTPLWVIGQAYADADEYAQKFFQLAKKESNLLRYEGPVEDRAQLAGIYREARGFALLSAFESLSLSALEAAACECPLLLGDLPWAKTVFQQTASYCPITPSTAQTAQILRRFYEAAPGLKPPTKPLTWIEVAQQLKNIYERLPKTSR